MVSFVFTDGIACILTMKETPGKQRKKLRGENQGGNMIHVAIDTSRCFCIHAFDHIQSFGLVISRSTNRFLHIAEYKTLY